MARSSAVFVCRECGGESLRWQGQCPHCRAWNTLEEFVVPRGRKGRAEAQGGQRATPIAEVDAGEATRLVLPWGELNRVLGGGVVPGSLVLLGGEPGVGKSTLLLQLAVQATSGEAPVLYISAEESPSQVALRARRMDALAPGLLLLSETDLEEVVAAIDRERPGLVVVDSVQTVQDPALESAAGSVSQVREVAARLMRLAKSSGVTVFLVGHVTKEGAIAGPRVLEHLVDTVLYLEGDRHQEIRILRATKNRFGSAEEIGLFSMGEGGLEEVSDPGALLLGEAPPAPGTAVLASLEGSRPLLVELQGLVVQGGPMPRRSANGVDLNRLHMLLAVLQKRAGQALGDKDVFVNVAGGMRVTEPAADLGLALAVAGSAQNRVLPERTVVIGEVGLTGDVRRVPRLDRRLQEAVRRGFAAAVVPAGTSGPPGLRLVEVPDLGAALRLLEPAAATTAPR